MEIKMLARISAILMINLIVGPAIAIGADLLLKWNIVIDGFGRFSFFKSLAICLDEFNGVADDLEGAAVLSVIGRPFVLVQNSGNGDSCSFVQIGGANLGQFVEGDNLDPAGPLFA